MNECSSSGDNESTVTRVGFSWASSEGRNTKDRLDQPRYENVRKRFALSTVAKTENKSQFSNCGSKRKLVWPSEFPFSQRTPRIVARRPTSVVRLPCCKVVNQSSSCGIQSTRNTNRYIKLVPNK